MVKNEEILLTHLLPIWESYPIEKFVFFNDHSTDGTVELIKKILGGRAVIINNTLDKFHESYNRSNMLEYSRGNGATHVIAFDCDELLSYNFVEHFDELIKFYDEYDLWLYWFNVVGGTLGKIRNDSSYADNYRSFILPLKHTGQFDLNLWQYHTPRVPSTYLPNAVTKDVGVIHLQAINRKFYALKQLWYKTYEYKEYGKSVGEINATYDPVVNGLNFCEVDTPDYIVGDLSFDASVFDEILSNLNYVEYIKENAVDELITFGQEYLND